MACHSCISNLKISPAFRYLEIVADFKKYISCDFLLVNCYFKLKCHLAHNISCLTSNGDTQ